MELSSIEETATTMTVTTITPVRSVIKTTYYMTMLKEDLAGNVVERISIEVDKATYHAFTNWLMQQKQGAWRRTAKNVIKEGKENGQVL